MQVVRRHVRPEWCAVLCTAACGIVLAFAILAPEGSPCFRPVLSGRGPTPGMDARHPERHLPPDRLFYPAVAETEIESFEEIDAREPTRARGASASVADLVDPRWVAGGGARLKACAACRSAQATDLHRLCRLLL